MSNGFKNSTKTQMGHSFPSEAGFTGSTGAVKTIGPYTRKIPDAKARAVSAMGDAPSTLRSMKSSMDKVADKLPKFAKGGSVGNATTQRDQPANELDVIAGGKTPLRPGFAKGGKWIAKATKNKGTLHKALHVKEGEKIPQAKLEKAENSKNPTMRKRAALAETLETLHKAEGGKVSDVKNLVDKFNQLQKDAKSGIPQSPRAQQRLRNKLRQSGYDFTGKGDEISPIVDSASKDREGFAVGGYAKGGKSYAGFNRKPLAGKC